MEMIPLEGAEEEVRESFENFSAEQCRCFLPEDKARLLKIVEGVSGGVSAFEAKVQGLLNQFRTVKPLNKTGLRKCCTRSRPRRFVDSSRFLREKRLERKEKEKKSIGGSGLRTPGSARWPSRARSRTSGRARERRWPGTPWTAPTAPGPGTRGRRRRSSAAPSRGCQN